VTITLHDVSRSLISVRPDNFRPLGCVLDGRSVGINSDEGRPLSDNLVLDAETYGLALDHVIEAAGILALEEGSAMVFRKGEPAPAFLQVLDFLASGQLVDGSGLTWDNCDGDLELQGAVGACGLDEDRGRNLMGSRVGEKHIH
jgi:hypothetical protein